MADTAAAELDDIKKELQSIIDELNDISNGVRKDFTGIRNDQVANVIQSVSAKCVTVKGTLNKINPKNTNLKTKAVEGAKALFDRFF